MKKRRVVIVEDIESNKNFLSRLIQQKFKNLEIVETFLEGTPAIEFLNENPVDLIFLDIRLIDMHGFELLELVSKKHYVIFTTAYPQYAVDSYEVKNHVVVDFIRKPIKLDRLKAAVDKFEEKTKNDFILKKKAPNENTESFYENIIYLSGGLHNISYICKLYRSRYCELVLSDSRIIECKTNISELVEILPDNFIQISKQEIVNMKLATLDKKNKIVIIDRLKKHISRNYFDKVLAAFAR